jgi:hypothetical protein
MASSIDICAFCQYQKKIRDSHIVPKFVFDHLRKDELHRRMHVISPDSNPKKPYAQDGPKCELLCDDCERFFDESFERDFLKCWFSEPVHPTPIPMDLFRVQVPDYRKFKLFHLSVIWRAYAASLKEASQGATSIWRWVYLKDHAARIREMLMNQDAGSLDEYPISGYYAVSPHQPSAFSPALFMPPIAKRLFGVNCFYMIFAGMGWIYFISKHTTPEIRKVCLQEDGSMLTCRHSVLDNEYLMGVAAEDFARRAH